MLHGGLFYYAVRRHIYHARVSDDFPAIVTRAVGVLLEGMQALAARSGRPGGLPVNAPKRAGRTGA